MAFDVSILPSILGMGAKIGGAIPGLKKPKRTNSGGRAAARVASQAGGAAVGAAQAGHGASRGLALRSGIRSAAKVVGEASGQAADAAGRDEILFNDQMNQRNERIGDLTGGIAEGLGAMTQALITPEDNKVQDAAIQDQPEMAQNSGTGLSADGGPAAGSADQQDSPAQQALQSTTDGLADPDGPGLVDLEQEFADEAAGPTADFKSTKALEELIANAPTTAGAALEADLENRLAAKKMMMQDAERLGYNMDGILAMINRRFDLKPGQSEGNPLGVSLDFNGQGEE